MAAARRVDELTGAHLLLLPASVTIADVEQLAIARFAGVQRDSEGIRLSRLSRIDGPFEVDRRLTGGIALRDGQLVGYTVTTPQERGDPPYRGLPDRDGLTRAFPEGLPIREEARVVNWLLAVARRLGGAVRTVPRGVVLAPSFDSYVDLTVVSDVWLYPDAALSVLSGVLPHAALILPGEWQGPQVRPGPAYTDGLELLDAETRRQIHERAAAFDAMAMAQDEPTDVYSLGSDLGADGRMDVEVSVAEDLPPVVANRYLRSTPVQYVVRWTPVRPDDLDIEHPPLDFVVARRRAVEIAQRVARAMQNAVGGSVFDMDGFPVTLVPEFR